MHRFEFNKLEDCLTELLNETLEKFIGVPAGDLRWDKAIDCIHKVGCNAINIVSFQSDTKSINWVKSSMNLSWISDYIDQDFVSCDPLMENLGDDKSCSFVDAGVLSSKNSQHQQKIELNQQLYGAGYQSIVGIRIPGNSIDERRLVVLSSEFNSNMFLDQHNAKEIVQFAMLLSTFISTPVDRTNSSILPYGLSNLSPREIDVLLYLAAGLRNDAIAFKLNIKEVTVRKTIISARTKLGAKTREQALVLAIKNGLITP